ncbi:MAG: 2Fe-2S iron-sulfur cluster binding domain-containing protein [Zoogloeaceae bacterium]|nr:2Fe-2S iron-sulfur cluster binding domain-containing protein [Zoogloeaceae bacterium]
MKKIRLYPSNREVDCNDGDTVLHALEKAGYALPNNCRAGACGECKVRVREGQFDQGMVLDMALSQDERKQGFGLMCMAKPLSEELVIEWGTEDAKPKLFAPRENVSFVLTDKVMRTPRIVELTLMPLSQPLRFWPGQYVTLGGGRVGIPDRSYSIANAPRQDGAIVLQVARQDEGVTSIWVHDELQVGDLVRLSGPYGTFIGDPAVDTPVLCIAAGSGLAPILSLADAALRRGFKAPVALVFSARTEADVYDKGLMAYWQLKYRNFRFIPTLTREQAPGMQHGRVPDILPKLFPDLAGHSIFAAGSPGFVTDCVSAAKALGGRDELIHTEGFFSQSQADASAVLS